MKRNLCICAFLYFLPALVGAQSKQVKQVRLSEFVLQSSSIVSSSGKELSSPDFVANDYWFPVTVPCTVLSGLVQNKIYADPYSGMNNMLIPDASDSFNHQYLLERYSFLPNEPNPWKKPYWYRTRFTIPSTDAGKRFQLIFKGINYRADVWINGIQVADSSQMAGMFAEYSLNISQHILAGKTNSLAIKIYPLDYPGLPAHPQLDALGDFYDNGGPTGDIGKNVTMLSSAGWDWIPEVRDRNMGIWLPVYLRTTGHTIITKTQVITDLPNLPDTGLAKIKINLVLNRDETQSAGGKLQVDILPENFRGNTIRITKEIKAGTVGDEGISLQAGEFPALSVTNPKLWWPNGHGEPNLYRVHIRYTTNGNISDDTSFVVGIRTMSSKTELVNGWVRRDFFVNGKKIHLVGGAWVPDMMLNRDSLRYDYEIRLCRNANVNLVRIWGGGLGETDEFYEAADRYGMLVWQDFWITGDTNGGFKGSEKWPLQANVFLDNVRSTILRIRNHASLLVWTGGNEGHAREELYSGMRDAVATMDGTRPFIPCSSGFSKAPASWKGSWPDDKPAGVYSGGPYAWVGEKEYFKLADRGMDWVFKDETGLPSQPPYNSLVKIIPNLVPDTSLPYPLNNSWGYHDACSGNGKYDVYYNTMVKRFGKPESIKDFSIKMQLLNASGYRAIFEAAGHKLNETGGVMLWKLNAAFPSVIWQIYDWYLEPNAGYYFMQNACEPLHIQMNENDSSIVAVNRNFTGLSDIYGSAELFNISGKSVFTEKINISVKAESVTSLFQLNQKLKDLTGIYFLVLNLKDKAGHTLSRNTYWLSKDNDFNALKNMPGATVKSKLIKKESVANENSWTYEFSNESGQFAFFINPQLWRNNEEIMPTLWTTNYFSLAPGEKITVRASCPNQISKDNIVLKLEGWNIKN